MIRASTLVPLAALAALAAISTVSTAAADDTSAFERRMFGSPVGAQRAEACFVRHYDAAHLAQHKRQKVTDMKLLVAAEILPEDAQPAYSYHVEMKLRTQTGDFTGTGDCGHAYVSEPGGERAQIVCDIGCEDFGLKIKLAGDDKSTTLELNHITISPRGKKARNAERTFEGTADNRTYRLDRAPLADCQSLLVNRVAAR
jgi:hypothetical protein